MAQNITLMGANYSAVPAVQLPKTGGGTARFDDATVTTATAADVAQGKVFIASDGTITTGTASGGGGSVYGWTKIAETTYTINATNTSASTTATLGTGHSELWTSSKWVYVRVRDTQGKRSGYFYGTDNFLYNTAVANGTSSSYTSTCLRLIIRYSNGQFTASPQTGTTGYGVYADYVYTDGRVRIRQRYNSNTSLTINSTYKVEVYLLDQPDGVPIFD